MKATITRPELARALERLSPEARKRIARVAHKGPTRECLDCWVQVPLDAPMGRCEFCREAPNIDNGWISFCAHCHADITPSELIYCGACAQEQAEDEAADLAKDD